jgi:hypothetical protein
MTSTSSERLLSDCIPRPVSAMSADGDASTSTVGAVDVLSDGVPTILDDEEEFTDADAAPPQAYTAWLDDMVSAVTAAASGLLTGHLQDIDDEVVVALIVLCACVQVVNERTRRPSEPNVASLSARRATKKHTVDTVSPRKRTRSTTATGKTARTLEAVERSLAVIAGRPTNDGSGTGGVSLLRHFMPRNMVSRFAHIFAFGGARGSNTNTLLVCVCLLCAV